MRIFIILLFLTFTAQGNIYAQEPINNVANLEEERIVYANAFPNLFRAEQISDIEYLNEKHARITYLSNGVVMEATVNHARKDMLLVTKAIRFQQDNVPDLLIEAHQEGKYHDYLMKNAWEVKTPSGERFFRVDYVENPNAKEQHAWYTNYGNERPGPL